MRLRDIKQLASGHTITEWQGWDSNSCLLEPSLRFLQCQLPATDSCHPERRLSGPLRKQEGCHATEANESSLLLRRWLVPWGFYSFHYYFESSETTLFSFFIPMFIQSSFPTVHRALRRPYRDLGPLVACTWFRRGFQLAI